MSDKLIKQFSKEPADTDLLALKCPTYIDFMPSDECLAKMFKRVMQLTEKDVLKYGW